MSGIVLIVADEFGSIEKSLLTELTHEGFLVEFAGSSGLLPGRLDALRPSVVLVDIGAGVGTIGLDLCRVIRTYSCAPIIVMSDLNSAADSVAIAKIGADDYVKKPYRPRELVARITAAMRRSRSEASDDRSWTTTTVDHVSIDLDAHSVTVAGVAVQLSLKEFELLYVLMVNAGRAVSRATLVERIWGRDFVGHNKRLDVHVLRLRSKLERACGQPSPIVTVRGVGYRFEESNQVQRLAAVTSDHAT